MISLLLDIAIIWVAALYLGDRPALLGRIVATAVIAFYAIAAYGHISHFIHKVI